MKNFFKLSLPLLLVSSFFTSLAYGYSVTTSYISNPVYSTSEIGDWSTTGADMDGMEVTVYYDEVDADGNYITATASWGATGATSGQASGVDWSLSLSNDSFFYTWVFSSDSDTGIVGFSLNGISGDTAFDLTYGNQDGTENSESGATFEVYSQGFAADEVDEVGVIAATYSGALALDGSSPVGDLYTNLEVMFYDTEGDALALSSLYFRQDTDNSVTEIDPTPEPISMLLFGTGVAGLVGTRIRRKRQ